MGNVLKRRDNAAIVKDIYGGVVEILMKDKNLPKSIKFVHECLNNMINEKYSIEKLLVTKSLRGYYKNPNQIAHKVLSERIAVRVVVAVEPSPAKILLIPTDLPVEPTIRYSSIFGCMSKPLLG